MKRTNTFLAAVALVLILTPAILLAQPPGRGGGGFHRGGPMGDRSPVDRLAERLDLTEEQRAAIEAIFEDFREDLQLRGQAVRDAQVALADAAVAEILDQEAVRALGQELGAAQAEMAITRALLHQQIRQQLTPEQQELFDQRREDRPFGRHGRGFGPGGGGYGPGGRGYGPGRGATDG